MKDTIVIGGGPVGIYAGHSVALRGLSVTLLEGSDHYGGQPMQVFAKKDVFDMPGIAKATGETVVQGLLEQYDTQSKRADKHLNKMVEEIKEIKGGFEVVTNDGNFKSKTVILATGNGIYKPRPLGLDEKGAKNILYTVKDFNIFKNKNVVVFGGGDSALDWANMIADNGAKNVSLVHRRNEFRAKGESVNVFRDKNNTEILTPFAPESLEFKGSTVKGVVIKSETEQKTIECDYILVNFGAMLNRDLIKTKEPLVLEKGKLAVNEWQETNIKGIFAVGNAISKEGKLNIMVTGFGEAAVAAAGVATNIDPSASPMFLSSSMAK